MPRDGWSVADVARGGDIPVTPQPDQEFNLSVEWLLVGMGAMMTLGVLIFALWLLRQMLREERAHSKRDEGKGGT